MTKENKIEDVELSQITGGNGSITAVDDDGGPSGGGGSGSGLPKDGPGGGTIPGDNDPFNPQGPDAGGPITEPIG